ncbi:Fungal specific transcription factor [Pleurostoma richardsiae]|uniref:Fungal specific transcription factor n=1 Tax=Pleurostoma richardsiae TaxID=41990 RepID=A0AA38RG10_9PEZI|nr:Fungal specific transcription factor [Pleurostoma richardsiae]
METSERPSWWCFLNAIIAISLHKKTVNKSFSEVSEFGWGFFKNAYAILPQLILQGNDLEVVQALLAMAMFMRNTGDTRTTARLLSVATRTVHTIGLHRKAVGSAWDPVQVETQRRVLWACYILDTDVSFNCGLPIAHSDEISETDVPNEASLDGCGLVKFSERSANIFRLRAHLAVVQSEVARRLYATKLHNKSGPPLLETMSELDSALEEQRSRIPIEIRPSDNAEPAVPMLDIPVVTFLFAYYNCVSMLHWTVVRNGPETLLRALPQMQTITSFVKLRRAATATIQLLQHLPAPPFADLWRILCYPVSACITLLANVLLCPYSPEARSDAKTIMSFVLFVEKMMKEEGCNLKNVLRGCFEMSKVANAAIVNAGTGAGSPAQGLSQTSEDVASLLKSLTHPMYLAQGLMGNLPNRDAEIVQEFSTALGFSSEEGNQYGCFVPTSLKPETYAFSFGPGGVGQDGASYGE